MKGIVFNLLEDAITAVYGGQRWESILEAADVSGAYTSLGSYDDVEFTRLIDTASRQLDLGADDIVRWFGEQSIPRLAAKYPQFFDAHSSSRSFVLSLNQIIHPEVRKLYPGADVPVFEFDNRSSDQLVMAYRSRRQLCSLAIGLLEGTARHYGERVSIEHDRCARRGAPACEFRIRFIHDE